MYIKDLDFCKNNFDLQELQPYLSAMQNKMFLNRFFMLGMSFLAISDIYASDTLKIAFGSCNRQEKAQDFWNEIAMHHPDRWIWLGDNIYADTEDMEKMKADYERQKTAFEYERFIEKVSVDGVWDDHDYGKNDAGYEYSKKDSSRLLFLDFIQHDSATRQAILNRGGTYYRRILGLGDLNVCMVFLDTRWFRSALVRSGVNKPRYLASDTGTILGEEQWVWLDSVITNPNVDLFIISSSIQVLSTEHGWEKWGNFPKERKRLLQLLEGKKALILSGDRHITEFSMLQRTGQPPLYDFTSSGLTHSWKRYEEERNDLRVGKLFNVTTFGTLELWKDVNGLNVVMNMHQIGQEQILQKLIAFYPFEEEIIGDSQR